MRNLIELFRIWWRLRHIPRQNDDSELRKEITSEKLPNGRTLFRLRGHWRIAPNADAIEKKKTLLIRDVKLRQSRPAE